MADDLTGFERWWGGLGDSLAQQRAAEQAKVRLATGMDGGPAASPLGRMIGWFTDRGDQAQVRADRAAQLGAMQAGAPAPAAVAKPVPPLPVGTFDAPVAPQTFRNPTARAAQTPLMQRAPNAPSYTLDDFMRETAGMTNRQLEQLYKTLPGRPKPPTAKEQAGNTLFNMIQNDFIGGLQAATTDDEKRAVYDRTQRALQGMYGVDPFTAYMMQQGAMPEE